MLICVRDRFYRDDHQTPFPFIPTHNESTVCTSSTVSVNCRVQGAEGQGFFNTFDSGPEEELRFHEANSALMEDLRAS